MKNPGYWFLATPYRSHPRGPDGSFEETSRELAVLANAGISAYSLIVQMHPAMKYGAPSATDDLFWESFSAPMISASKGLIVCQMPGIYHPPIGNQIIFKSVGVEEEIENFKFAGKPILLMRPGKAPTKEDLELPATTRRLSNDEYDDLASCLNNVVVFALKFFGSKYYSDLNYDSSIATEMRSAIDRYLDKDNFSSADKVVFLSRSIRSGLRLFQKIRYDRDREWHLAETCDALKSAKKIYDKTLKIAPADELQNNSTDHPPAKPGL